MSGSLPMGTLSMFEQFARRTVEVPSVAAMYPTRIVRSRISSVSAGGADASGQKQNID